MEWRREVDTASACVPRGLMSNIPIYVINLARAGDRLASMQAVLGRLNLAFERIEAVDAAELTPDRVRTLVVPRLGAAIAQLPFFLRTDASGPMIYIPEHHRYLVAGEIACHVSHSRAITACIESAADGAMIFEDDVEIDADFPALLQAVSELPRGRRIVKFEGLARVRELNLPVARAGGRDINLMLKPTTGAAAYYISREAAVHLLPRLFPIREPYDAFLRQYWRHGIDVLEMVPFPVRQRPTGSMIDGRLNQPVLAAPAMHAALLAAAKPMFKGARLLRRAAFFASRLHRLGALRRHSTPASRPAS
jgi:glycosyl transferase family 25